MAARAQRPEALGKGVGHAGSIRARLRSVVLRAALKYATDFDRCVYLAPFRLQAFVRSRRARLHGSFHTGTTCVHRMPEKRIARVVDRSCEPALSGVRLHPGSGRRRPTITNRACETR